MNITIPQSCWDAYTDKLVLSMTATRPVSSSSSYGQCYNGSSWNTITPISSLGSYSSDFWSTGENLIDGNWSTKAYFGTPLWKECTDGDCYYAEFYEEAMWWNVTGINLNTSTKTIYSGSIPSGSSVGVWCYLNLNNPSSGKLGKVIFNITN